MIADHTALPRPLDFIFKLHSISIPFFTQEKNMQNNFSCEIWSFLICSLISFWKDVISKMIADHDHDLVVQDFDKVIVSDHRSQYCKSIVSDRTLLCSPLKMAKTFLFFAKNSTSEYIYRSPGLRGVIAVADLSPKTQNPL